MKNYYEFTKLDEDVFTINIFNGMNDKKLKTILDNYFNEIDIYLNLFANTLKSLFKGNEINKANIKFIND